MKNETMTRLQHILLIAALGMATQAVFGQTAFVTNPSFEFNSAGGYPGYSSIDDWSGGSGLNNISGPFSNAGIPIADRAQAAFIQHSGTLSQTITGLTTNEPYWVQFWYMARNCCGGSGTLLVLFNGTQIATIPNVQVMDTSYQFMNVSFTPTTTNGVLEFQLEESVSDLTVNLDAVNIVQGGSNDVVLMNPSFEASGPPSGSEGEAIAPALMAGWTWDTNQTGTYGISLTGGTYADNGAIPDQALVGFISGPGSLSQTVSRLFVGSNYQLSYFYNAQMAPGTNAQMQVTANGVLLDSENVAPVGGSNPYYSNTVSFIPTNSTVTISFAQTNSGGTLLLDNIRLIGAVAPEYSMAMSPAVLDIAANQTSTVQVTVPAGFLASSSSGAQINVSLGNTSAAQIVGAGANGVLTLQFQGTNTVQTFQILGLRRGDTSVQATVPSGLNVSQLTSVNVFHSFVLNPSFEDSLADTTPVPAWNGGATVETASGPDFDNGILPDRTQLAVLQGTNILSQQIFNFTPGKSYWLQFRYDASYSDSQSGVNGIDLNVKLGGNLLATITNILPAGISVGDVPFYFTNITFLPTNASELLEFDTTPTIAGTTPALLLDAVSMVQRDTNDIVIENPSFEASGEGPGPGYLAQAIDGWLLSTPGGSGINFTPGDPFGDNGLTPDQSEVLFIEYSGTASATINGLITNQVYTLSYAVNRRQYVSAPSDTLSFSVYFGDLTLVTNELLFPVGDDNPFLMQYWVFTNDAPSQDLQFVTATEGDVTFLLDNVKLEPGMRVPPQLGSESPTPGEVSVLQPILQLVITNGSYPLNTNTLQLLFNGSNVTAQATLTLTNSPAPGLVVTYSVPVLSPSTTYTVELIVSDENNPPMTFQQTYTFVTQSAPSLTASLSNGQVILSWPAASAGFTLQETSALPGGWTNSVATVTAQGTTNAVTITPSEPMKFYRLEQ
jgi:hypothetical protein